MEIFENKGKFYDRLWLDYQQNKIKKRDEDDERPSEEIKKYDIEAIKKSFVFTYFANIKNKAAEKLAKDRVKFDELRKKQKFGNWDDKYVFLVAAHKLFVETEGEQDMDAYCECFQKAAKNIYISKKHPLSPESKESYEQLSYILLDKEIYKFFYDKGYRQTEYNEKETKSQRSAPTYINEKNEIDDIDMFYQYFNFINSGKLYVKRPFKLSPKHKKASVGLYNALINSGNDLGEICFPLYFDPSSGASITIIGDLYNINLQNDEFSVYTMRFEAVDSIEDEANGKRILVEYRGKEFESVEDAFNDFAAESSAVEDTDRYSGYYDANSSLSYKLFNKNGLEQFLRYLKAPSAIDQDERRAKLRQETINKMREEEAAKKMEEAAQAKAEKERREKEQQDSKKH